MKNLIQVVFQTAIVLKLHHWNPTSPGKLGSAAEHQVLGELYDYLNDKVDFLVETYQGYEGLLDIKLPSCDRSIAPLKAIEILCEMLEKTIEDKECPDWFSNELQEIQANLYKGMYKLINLK